MFSTGFSSGDLGGKGTVDSPASDEDIQRRKRAVESHCPVLDIIGNATPIAVTVRKKDVGCSAMHAP